MIPDDGLAAACSGLLDASALDSLVGSRGEGWALVKEAVASSWQGVKLDPHKVHIAFFRACVRVCLCGVCVWGGVGEGGMPNCCTCLHESVPATWLWSAHAASPLQQGLLGYPLHSSPFNRTSRTACIRNPKKIGDVDVIAAANHAHLW